MGNCLHKNHGKHSISSPKESMVTNPSLNSEMVVADRRQHTTMLLGADDSADFSAASNSQPQSAGTGGGGSASASNRPQVVLVPHQHTLFCERKQRVCTAVGRCQEMEVLRVQNLPAGVSSYHWVRTSDGKSGASNKTQYTKISGSENHLEYTLQREDVDMFVGLSYKSKDGEQLAENWIGPILPGPPRVLEFRIEGDDEEGGTIIAKADYIGGYEGYSEYWWLRISAAGQRTQISDPKPIPKGTPGGPNDPRYYTLTKDDIGCTLKAKCRPMRTDGFQGEIFTSKASVTIKAK